MQNPSLDPDGLRLSTHLLLSDLIADETMLSFAAGLIPKTLEPPPSNLTLLEALTTTDDKANALLTTLLALDAEVEANVASKRRVFPLAGFLSYRSSISPDRFPLSAVRLPPLNPDGHYFFRSTDEAAYLAVRLDLHPTLKVLGHVRIAVSHDTISPTRLYSIEQRLDRKALTTEIIAEVVAGRIRNPVLILPPVLRSCLHEVLSSLEDD